MTHTQTDVFFYEDGRFEEGYKPGTIRIRIDNGMGGVNVHIMKDDPREQLRQLRDLCQSQIDALDVQSEPLRCPSVHGDQRCHWMLGHKGPHQEGNEVWTHDAPIEQGTALQDHIEQAEFVPVMTLPGHAENCCCDDCVPF